MEDKEGCGGCRVVQDIPQDILQAARFSLYIYGENMKEKTQKMQGFDVNLFAFLSS